MCGIAGILLKRNRTSVSSQMISEMCDVMSHRGPDDHGIFTTDNLALGHRRLSIIDLGSGHQPMQSQDNRYTIVFNGEIYNYLELRNELQKSGAHFITNSDTEVILQLYRRYGKDCVNKLNGIFAFCIFDRETKELFLARDHAGVKPLYYCDSNNEFIFASEIKAILKTGLVQARCNLATLPEYFIFRQVAGPETLFKDIYALPPGHYILIRDSRIEIKQYWDINNTVINNKISHDEALDSLDGLLTDAVKLQMMSDVPLGTFCSGGVDSSLVTAIASINSANPINTYSVGFEEKEYDETKYARMVSKKYGTTHHELILNNIEFSSHLEKAIWHNDLPLNFANSVLIYALSTLAKKSVTVVLTGEGADELLAGYPRYYIPTIRDKLKFIPSPLLKMASSSLSIFKDHRVKKLASFMRSSLDETLLYNNATLSQHEIDIYNLRRDPSEFAFRNSILVSNKKGRSTLSRVANLDQQTYLISILNRQDKMSMAASIESRVPILDYRLIEFTSSLPDNLKHSKFQPKFLLKELAERYLPRELIYRQKSGFGVPLRAWFSSNGGISKLANEYLTNKNLEELEWDGDIAKVLQEHKMGKFNHSEFLWTALNFTMWKHIYSIS